MTGIVELLKKQDASYDNGSGGWVAGIGDAEVEFINSLVFRGRMQYEYGPKSTIVLKNYTIGEIEAAYAKFKVEREV